MNGRTLHVTTSNVERCTLLSPFILSSPLSLSLSLFLSRGLHRVYFASTFPRTISPAPLTFNSRSHSFCLTTRDPSSHFLSGCLLSLSRKVRGCASSSTFIRGNEVNLSTSYRCIMYQLRCDDVPVTLNNKRTPRWIFPSSFQKGNSNGGGNFLIN